MCHKIYFIFLTFCLSLLLSPLLPSHAAWPLTHSQGFQGLTSDSWNMDRWTDSSMNSFICIGCEYIHLNISTALFFRLHSGSQKAQIFHTYPETAVVSLYCSERMYDYHTLRDHGASVTVPFVGWCGKVTPAPFHAGPRSSRPATSMWD